VRPAGACARRTRGRVRPAVAVARAVAGLLAVVPLVGCGPAPGSVATGPRATSIPSELIRQARPIGRGPRFAPPVRGSVPGACVHRRGPRVALHVEVFAADRVVLVAAGIGTRAPRRLTEGRISHAACYGALVTLEPTGVVLVRPSVRLTVGDLFAAWGQPLTATRLASFGGGPVRAFVDGRRRRGPVAAIPLTRHAEIVLEIGPRVPPHSGYRFPPGT